MTVVPTAISCIVLYCKKKRCRLSPLRCSCVQWFGLGGFTNAYTRVPLDSLHPPFAGYPSPCRDSTPWGLLTLYNYGSYCYRSVTVLTAKIKSVLNAPMELLVYLNTCYRQAASQEGRVSDLG